MQELKVYSETGVESQPVFDFKTIIFCRWLRFQKTKLYDFLAALPLAIFYIYAIVNMLPQLRSQIEWAIAAGDHSESLNLGLIVNLIVGLTMVFSFIVFILVLLFRRKPIARSSGIRIYIAAVYGTFLSHAITELQPRSSTFFLQVISLFIILAGAIFTIYSVLSLGRSFSILPEARKLVMTGAYAFVRHPLYLGELVVLAGITLHFASLTALFLLILIIYFQIERMKYEEKILSEVFPEYLLYMKKTFRLIPRIY